MLERMRKRRCFADKDLEELANQSPDQLQQQQVLITKQQAKSPASVEVDELNKSAPPMYNLAPSAYTSFNLFEALTAYYIQILNSTKNLNSHCSPGPLSPLFSNNLTSQETNNHAAAAAPYSFNFSQVSTQLFDANSLVHKFLNQQMTSSNGSSSSNNAMNVQERKLATVNETYSANYGPRKSSVSSTSSPAARMLTNFSVDALLGAVK